MKIKKKINELHTLFEFSIDNIATNAISTQIQHKNNNKIINLTLHFQSIQLYQERHVVQVYHGSF